jgi:rhodanese-related sulfurtransferase
MAADTKTDQIDVEEARRQIASGDAQALDLRDEEAREESHIPGSAASPQDLEQGGRVVLVSDGDPPDDVVSGLTDDGFEVAILEGGMDAWKKADFTVQPSDDPGEEEGAEGPGRDETPA